MAGKSRARLERRRLALDELKRRYPAIFTLCVPLAVDIHEALSANLDGLLSREQLRDALGQWCSSKSYLRCLKASTARLNLAGEQVGSVSEEAARHARMSRYGTKKTPREPGVFDDQDTSPELRG